MYDQLPQHVDSDQATKLGALISKAASVGLSRSAILLKMR